MKQDPFADTGMSPKRRMNAMIARGISHGNFRDRAGVSNPDGCLYRAASGKLCFRYPCINYSGYRRSD